MHSLVTARPTARRTTLPALMLVVGITWHWAGAVQAQQQQPSGATGEEPTLDTDTEATPEERSRIAQRVRALRAWKLTQALELDEATAARLFPILERYDDKFARVARETRALRERVRRLAAAGDATERAEFERVLDLLVANQRKLWALQDARFDEVRKVLSPSQAATTLMLLPELDRHIHREARRALRPAPEPGEDRAGDERRPAQPGR